jgi:hypothetical protein
MPLAQRALISVSHRIIGYTESGIQSVHEMVLVMPPISGITLIQFVLSLLLFDRIARQLLTHCTTSAETAGATVFQVLPHLMQLIVVT